jgi:hypothetical protein
VPVSPSVEPPDPEPPLVESPDPVEPPVLPDVDPLGVVVVELLLGEVEVDEPEESTVPEDVVEGVPWVEATRRLERSRVGFFASRFVGLVRSLTVLRVTEPGGLSATRATGVG